MTEPIIITSIIVGGLVAAVWIVFGYAFKYVKLTQQQSSGDGSISVQIGGDADAEAISRRIQDADHLRYLSAN